MKVRVDRSLCVGHGRCYALASEVFDSDDDGMCVIRDEDVDVALVEIARRGALACPEGAITIDE